MDPRIMLLTGAALSFGSGAYVFSALLDPMARDLGVSVAAVGQLQTAFVASAAIGGPLLAVWGQRMDRKRLLVIALAAVTTFTAWCAFASHLGLLMLLRVLAGAAGGIIMPAAAAAAAAIAPASRRGSAIAMVLGGMTLAFLLGIPLGSQIGELFGWRATFLFAASLSGIACFAIAMWLPAISQFSAAGDVRVEWGRVVPLVMITLLSFAATMTVISYIGPVLEFQAGIQGGAVQGLGSGLGGLAIRYFGLPSVALLGAALGFIGGLLAVCHYHERAVQVVKQLES